MRIPSFEIRQNRSVQFAKCENVPRLMIIAGPNGAGKSTLLDSLRRTKPREHILYVGPHRSIRRQQVQQRHLMAGSISLEQLLARIDIPGFEGIRLFDGDRDAWSADDTGNYLKHALCQIEIERQQAISARFDRDGHIAKDSLPDTWKPLRDLTHSLLPHLAFDKIDNSNRDQVRCLWKSHSKNVSIDLDDLSSGEKSVVQMFYPLVEHQIKFQLQAIRNPIQATPRPPICVLIDEPELHLHPNLQVKVLDYLRVLTSMNDTQVIIATHSPTIVESAGFEELFLLRPAELINSGDNQLIQVANDEDKLKLLRDVFGTTSNLTAMQPLIIVEGADEGATTMVIADRKLYRALHRGFDSVTLLPGGGKAECRKLLTVLNQILSTFSSNLEAFALLDRDLERDASEKNVHLLPVSMVENFFLDPDAIWEAIQSVVEKTDFKSREELTKALDDVLTAMEAVEVDRVTRTSLGFACFRPKLPIADIPNQAQKFSTKVLSQFAESTVKEAQVVAYRKVATLREKNRRREEFHGKDVVDVFYKQYLHKTGLAKTIFKFEAARHARGRKSVKEFFDKFFEILKKTDPMEKP